MIITRVSMVSGKTRSMNLPVTYEQIELWQNGVNIQNAMPQLTASEREFIMTGITDDEWNDAFTDCDELLDEDFDHEQKEDYAF